MNLGLFFKLWAMEDVAHRMYLSTKHRLRERSEARSDNFLFLCNLDLSSVIDCRYISSSHNHSESRSICVGGEGEGVSLPLLFFCLWCLSSPHTRELLFQWVTILKLPVSLSKCDYVSDTVLHQCSSTYSPLLTSPSRCFSFCVLCCLHVAMWISYSAHNNFLLSVVWQLDPWIWSQTGTRL